MAEALTKDEIAGRLTTAYPDDVAGVEGNEVIFKDGGRLPFDDGKGEKSFELWLTDPDIEDMFRFAYPAAAATAAPVTDPGRARNSLFFRKIYGDCHKGGVAKNLTAIGWLPGLSRQTIKVTTRNGVAGRFRDLTNELANLPKRFQTVLMPSAGGYVCRDIAGTRMPSAHGYGIAVDIALKRSHYWRWGRRDDRTAPVYRNAIPMEIVAIFERHGFIWGGRWKHYDTMHFEYRPELFSPPSGPSSGR
ncbi:MAG: M15 family metallopeptidase [Hyphomicrobium sp.]